MNQPTAAGCCPTEGPPGPPGPPGPAPEGDGVVTVAAGVASATPVGDGLVLGATLAVLPADSSVTVGSTGVSVQTQLDATLASAEAFAQSLAYNISSKEPVHVATLVALPANTATTTVMTASANGALPLIDGESLLVGERVLVKDEGVAANNGIYEVTSLGDASNPWVLTRTDDANTAAELCGAQAAVDTGTQSGTVWLFSANQNTFVLGTNAVNWVPLQAPAATTLVPGIVQLAGDIGGSFTSVTVTGIQGNAVSPGALTAGQVLRATGAGASAFGALDLGNASAVTGTLPAASQASQSMGGDVTGTTAAATVAKIQGKGVSAIAPATSQVLAWSGTEWAPTTPSAGTTNLVGTYASIPAAGQAGRLYVCTDVPQSYIDTGSTWKLLSPMGGAITPAVAPGAGIGSWRLYQQFSGSYAQVGGSVRVVSSLLSGVTNGAVALAPLPSAAGVTSRTVTMLVGMNLQNVDGKAWNSYWWRIAVLVASGSVPADPMGSAGGAYYGFWVINEAGTNQTGLRVIPGGVNNKLTDNIGYFTQSQLASVAIPQGSTRFFVRITVTSAASGKVELSPDGVSWVTVAGPRTWSAYSLTVPTWAGVYATSRDVGSSADNEEQLGAAIHAIEVVSS